MTLSKSGIRQLLREYFEDYNAESRFIYTFGGEQFLIKETVNRSEGVSKHVIITLFDEYMDSYNIKENFIYDMQNCHFLIALQTAMFKELADNQTIISSKSANGFKMSKTPYIFDDNILNCGVNRTEYKSLSDDNPDGLHYCHILDKYCVHADNDNNREIGYTDCHGEYCGGIKEPFKTITDDKGFKHNDKIGRSGFGEDEVLG